MSTKPEGYGTVQLGGQERPFHVGFNQAAYFCELRGGMPLSDYNGLFDSLLPHLRADEAGGLALENGKPVIAPPQRKDLSMLEHRDFLYSALKAGYENDGLRVDFTPNMVGNWIQSDATGGEEAGKPIAEQMRQIAARYDRALERVKNAQAPVKGAKTKAKK